MLLLFLNTHRILALNVLLSLTDFPQILVDNSLMFVDPTGECFIDGGQSSQDNLEAQQLEASKLSPTARRYQITPEFPSQFPDQLEPFLSLPFGVKESFALRGENGDQSAFRGTIFRLPLRRESRRRICNRTFQEDDVVESLVKEIAKRAPSCFLFTYHLRSINIMKWLQSEAVYRDVLSTFLNSSPLARKIHYDDLTSNKDWKQSKNKLVKLLQSTWVPLQSSFQLQVSSRFGPGSDEGESEVIDYFLVRSVLAPTKLQVLACADALKQLKLTPALSVAAHIGRLQGSAFVRFPRTKGTLFVGLDTCEVTGLPFFVNAPLFQHELRGSILLDKDGENRLMTQLAALFLAAVTTIISLPQFLIYSNIADDAAFRSRFPTVRHVKVKNGEETRALVSCSCR